MEERGYKLVAIKSLVPSKKLASDHYADLSARKFFPSLVEYITCGVPVVAMWVICSSSMNHLKVIFRVSLKI